MSIEANVFELWRYFDSIDKEKYDIKTPSFPLLYLGNYKDYLKSELKIVTSELNPSKKEFLNTGFSRFNGIENKIQNGNDLYIEMQSYLSALNSYFINNPNDIFQHYEPILNQMRVSFYPGQQNTALNTYIGTPLTTNKSLSGYDQMNDYGTVEDLIRHGHETWLKIIDVLKPHIVLTSISNNYREKFFNKLPIKWTRFESFNISADGKKRKKPYLVDCAISSFSSGEKYLLILGSTGATPFMITENQKKILGRKIDILLTKAKKQSLSH